MNIRNEIEKKVQIAEKKVKELFDAEDLKRLSERDANNISQFYLQRSNIRLETSRIIFENSKIKETYSDFSEVVSATYYSMYYIVQAYLALKYKIKLRENVRGVHAITTQLVLYYLVKTNKLAEYLYEEYLKTLSTVAKIQDINLDDFQKEAFELAESYNKSRDNREIFTYATSKNAEEHNAENAIKIAEEFINIIKQLMLKK